MVYEEEMCANSFEGMPPFRGAGRIASQSVKERSAIEEMIALLEKVINENDDAFSRLSLKIGPVLADECPQCEGNEKMNGRPVSSSLGTKIMSLTIKLSDTTTKMNYLADRIEL